MRIRAAVLREMGLKPPFEQTRPLSIEEVELAGPGPGEVLVKVRAAGLCHSDLSVINGDRPRPLPMVIGHESAGVIEEVGAGVQGFAKGDHVVTVFVPSCGHCEPCELGRPALCEPGYLANSAGTLLSGASRLCVAGSAVMHHLGVSAFADYVVVAQESLVKVDHSLAFDEAALFGCAVITGVGAVMNTAQVPRGAGVAIFGLGGVGLAALMGCAMLEPQSLIAVDLNPEKLALATRLGATHALAADDPDCVAKIREATGGGVEFAFEMAGSIKAMEAGYAATRRGGTTVSAGLSRAGSVFGLQQVSLVAEERTIKGSYLGSCQPRRDIPRYVEWYQSGRLPVNLLLSEHLGLGDLNAGFDRLARGEALRQVVML